MDTREILNRKARHDFEVLETCEVGIVLRGTEVKSIRQGKASLQGAFAQVQKGEVWLIGANIEEYAQGNRYNHDPRRFRKLLLHRSEIRKLFQQCSVMGRSLIPLKMYFNDRGIAKVQLGICKSKTNRDRREDVKKRDVDREMRQFMKQKNNPTF